MMFEQFPDESRLWIFSIDPVLDQSRISILEGELNLFFKQWQAHGKALFADYHIIHNAVLIICINESMALASGCSIDAMNRFLAQMELKLQVAFFNRFLINCLDPENRFHRYHLTDLKHKLLHQKDLPKLNYYDSLIKFKKQLKSDFLKPLHSGWIASHLDV